MTILRHRTTGDGPMTMLPTAAVGSAETAVVEAEAILVAAVVVTSAAAIPVAEATSNSTASVARRAIGGKRSGCIHQPIPIPARSLPTTQREKRGFNHGSAA